MEEAKLPRREREKLRQRNEILAAALDLFAENGYHNVSMQQIAGKAEFAIGTLYRFFQNKEDLYRSLMLEQADQFDRSLSQAIATEGDEVVKLRCYIRAKAQRYRDNLSCMRLFLAQSRGASFNIYAGLDAEVRQRYLGFLEEKLAAVFASGIENGRFYPIADPFYLAVALDNVLNAFLILWVEAPDRHPFPDDPDTILQIFFAKLLKSA